jgi:hypothetical protein
VIHAVRITFKFGFTLTTSGANVKPARARLANLSQFFIIASCVSFLLYYSDECVYREIQWWGQKIKFPPDLLKKKKDEEEEEEKEKS